MLMVSKAGSIQSFVSQTTEQVTKISSSSNEQNYFTVAVNALNVRSEGDLSSKRIDLIEKGNTYKVLEKSGNWIKLELKKEKAVGFIRFTDLYPIQSRLIDVKTTPKTVYILSDGTNLRRDATTSSKVAVRANAGNEFPIVSETGDWYEVKLPSGENAFVASWVVSYQRIKQR